MAEYTKGLYFFDEYNLEIKDKDGRVLAKLRDGSFEEMRANGKLICVLHNVAVKLNPENPQAVTEGMEDIIGALRGMVGVYYSTSGDSSPRAYEFAQQALASIEGGK